MCRAPGESECADRAQVLGPATGGRDQGMCHEDDGKTSTKPEVKGYVLVLCASVRPCPR
jgi:hypothetical protein